MDTLLDSRSVANRTHDHWVGGQRTPPALGRYFPTLRPIDDSEIALVARGSPEDIGAAIDDAERAFADFRSSSVDEREAILANAAALLERDAEAFVDLLVDEIGSPISKARFEIGMAASAFRAAAGAARMCGGKTFPSGAPGRLSMSIRSPRGVVASITPFNVPLLIGVRATANPIAFGNAVVALPSEHAPLIALRLAELYREAGLPDGVLNVVTGYGAEIGDSLTGDPRVKAVMFTGSSVVGKHIARICGEQMKPVILELGGKSPLVILDDASLDQAVEGAIFGIFLFQGQVCMGSSRIYVTPGIHDEFVRRFISAAAKIGCGDLRDPATMVGPIISDRQRRRVRSHIENAVERGADLLVGGDWSGNVCRPTILANVKPDMIVFDEETFGPVVSIYPVASAEEALERANASRYGLSAAIYTTDINQALNFAQRVASGMVHINAPTLHDEPHVPFGGVRDSGFGRTGTEESLDALTEIKWVTIQL